MEKRTKEECAKACELDKWAYLHTNCPNMVKLHSDMEGERYFCKVCDKTYKIYYDEMR